MLGESGLYAARFSQFLKRSESRVRADNAVVEKFPLEETQPFATARAAGQDAAAEAKALLEDVAAYAQELQRAGTAPPRLEELVELQRSVEGFVAELGADARSPRAPSPKELMDALLTAAAPVPAPASADPQTLWLSGEVEATRAEQLGRRLAAAAAKLAELELLVGSSAPLQAKSLCVAVQEELRGTAYLDPAAATDVLRRLELVADEVSRQASDRRMNYFTQQQKQEMAKFFAEFKEAQEEFAAGAEPNPVSAAVDALEANQPLLRRAARFFDEGRDMAEALEELRREAEENRGALATLQAQLAANCRALEENLRLLKA